MDGRIAKELYSEALVVSHTESGRAPVVNADLQDEDNGSIWEETDEFDDKQSDLNQEWQRRRDQFHTIGYRDGLIAGKEASAQEGFNVGFKQSVAVGYKWGLVRGITSALACLTDDLKAKLVKTDEKRNKFQGLYESIHRTSTADAFKLICNDMVTEKEAHKAEQRISSSTEGGTENVLENYVAELQSLLIECPDIVVSSLSTT